MAVLVAVLPRLYLAYMWLVWKTSHVEEIGCDLEAVRAAYGRAVVALWHNEVFFVAWAFRRFRGHTLASRGDFGEVITRMLELCNFHVFRGGSSAGKSRRSPEVVGDMVAHMNRTPGVIYGITVDGSNGPAYRMKSGAIRIAIACQAPVLVEKTWCRRYLRLGTWDRTIVPLPFNRIVHVFAGPYLPPRDAYDPDALERFRASVEDALLDVTYHTHTLIEGRDAHDLFRDYPDGWVPKQSPPTLRHPFADVVIDPPAEGGRPIDGSGDVPRALTDA
jgi:hypothetical protein